MTTPTIDAATFRTLQDTAGAEFVVELVDTFLQEAPRMLEDLRSALAAGDAGKFRRAAHSLKSNASTFGALSFAASARELELAGLERVMATNPHALAALAEEYARVAAALGEMRNA